MAIVFDLRNWASHYITLHCDSKDACVKFSDLEIDVIDEDAEPLLAPLANAESPTNCCFKLAEVGTMDLFVDPGYPWLHAKRAYALNGFLRIAR